MTTYEAPDVLPGGTPESAQYRRLLDGVVSAGWLAAVDDSLALGEIKSAFFLPFSGRSDVSVEAVVNELALTSPDGTLSEGYGVSVDRQAGSVEVSYTGPFTRHYAVTLELLPFIPETDMSDGLNELRAMAFRNPMSRHYYLSLQAESSSAQSPAV